MFNELEILLVEDDADTRANLTAILKLDGYRVWTASSIAEVRNGGLRNNIALVILDRRLPDGDADQVLPELKSLLPDAEFIVVTGFGDLENSIAALKFGVVDYMLKPVDPGAIRHAVARIAHQKRIETELCREQRFANDVLTTAEAIVLVLDLEGHIIRFNPYFTRITGWNLDDIRNQDWFTTCIPEKDRGWVREVFVRTAHDHGSSGVLNTILTSGGRQRQVRWSSSTVKGDDGKVNSILAIGVDVTDLMIAEQAAKQSQRLAAIGETVAGLAHESRNALHRIQTSVEILQLDIPPDSELRVEVDCIGRAAVELHNALEEVRQYAAPIQLHIESTRLPEVWRRVWRYLSSSRQGRDVDLIEMQCDCDCPVDIDVLKIEQLFRNLFENALAACSDPVRIHLHCRFDGPDWVLFDLQDNGPGLTPEQRERMFEPFYTTKTRGTGLGLSIAKRIVEAHSGEIHVADPRGHGARFIVRLRRHPAMNSGAHAMEVACDATL